MQRAVATLVFAGFLAGPGGAAQSQFFPKAGDANPASGSASAFYAIGKRNVVAGAEKMPAEFYSYRPTTDVRTFGEIVAHIADAQFIFCSSARREPNPNGENLQSGAVAQTIEKSGKHGKDDLVAALKKSFSYCDPVFAADAPDANWSDTVKLNTADRPKSVPVILALIHLWEHYGNITTYLRLKGIVPPSSEPAPQPAAKPAEKQDQPPPDSKDEMPPGWKMRLDSENHDKAAPRFWTMPPGWHITSGPAAIYYDPQQTVSGDFRLDSESFLFPPGELNEGYGFFFGGKDLHNEKIAYTYFLIRRDGSFLIKQRTGQQTRDLVPWTAHPAIVKHESSTNVTARNQLAIETRGDQVDFFVNGQRVHTLSRAQAPTEGTVGLRVNHRVNAHITYLTIKPRGTTARKIEQEATVAGSLQEVWNAWTTVPGVTSFFGPGADLELKPGGKYEIYFDINEKKIGCNGCTVISFDPQRRLQYTWNAPPHLKNLRAQYSRVTLTFSRAGTKSTRVKMVHDEWGTGAEWDQAYAYFQQAWSAVLANLQYRFAKGPVEWKDGRFTRATLTPQP